MLFNVVFLFFVVGFHAVDLDSASVNDLFIPSQVSDISLFTPLTCHRNVKRAKEQL